VAVDAPAQESVPAGSPAATAAVDVTRMSEPRLPEPLAGAPATAYGTRMNQPREMDARPAERDPRDSEVVRILLESHSRFLDFVERRVRSRDVAEDILQDAFVRSLDRAPPLQKMDSVTAWFYRVLRNAIIDYRRRQSSRRRAYDRVAVEFNESVPAVDQELEAVVCACVMALLDTLKPDYATAVRRVDLEERSVRDYGAEAGITPGNAAVRLHRAREALRRQLARSCGSCLTHGCLDCRCGAPNLKHIGPESQ
jgi:RNA polymerase sigma factor (sigma-70 family)